MITLFLSQGDFCATAIKQYRRKPLVGVKHHVVFGTLGAIEQVLAGCGWKLNTAFVTNGVSILQTTE